VHQNQNSNVLSMISEMQPYPPHRYDSAYATPATHVHSAVPSRHIPPHHSQHHANMRSMNHQQPPQHWSQSHMMPSINPMDSYVRIPCVVVLILNVLFSSHTPRRGVWLHLRLMIITLDTHKIVVFPLIFLKDPS
jgi:hypothetical protein